MRKLQPDNTRTYGKRASYVEDFCHFFYFFQRQHTLRWPVSLINASFVMVAALICVVFFYYIINHRLPCTPESFRIISGSYIFSVHLMLLIEFYIFKLWPYCTNGSPNLLLLWAKFQIVLFWWCIITWYEECVVLLTKWKKKIRSNWKITYWDVVHFYWIRMKYSFNVVKKLKWNSRPENLEKFFTFVIFTTWRKEERMGRKSKKNLILFTKFQFST